jgi:outer membrane protein OmpA-like peptidoglycan-associated protein
MKNTLLILGCIFACTITKAQKQADIWYFGNRAGVSFATGQPLALSDSQLSTDEGCAVISDPAGKMLFYTDGISVWNNQHELMPNGKKLKGDPSSTQSGIAIQKPKAPGMYYLFTVAATGGESGIAYSLIDMQLDHAKGDIVADQKNLLLTTPVTEKLTAVAHRNGKDMWVIAHRWKSNEFLVYLVTENGVGTAPVVSQTGKVHEGGNLNTQGYMKSNPDGSNLALALEESGLFELFDFDNASGKVSQPVTLHVPEKSYPYGVEFSPDGSILYTSAAATGQIYQFNLQAGSPEAIQASALVVGTSPKGEWIGALQLANDGKIYFPIYQTEFLGAIHEPGKLGAACRYENNVVKLNGRTSTLGLPTFTQSFFTQDLSSKNINYFNEKAVALGKTFILKNINFDFAKYTLQSVSYVELKKVVVLLQQNPSYHIEIAGHTDNIGNKSSNILLSQNRAKAVRDYLVSQKIAADRVSFVGFGSSKPIANNETEAGRAKNRRVEFVLSK